MAENTYASVFRPAIERTRKLIGTRDEVESNLESLANDKDIKKYLSAAPEEEQGRLREALEGIVRTYVTKYQENLRGLGRKVTTGGAAILSVANDIYAAGFSVLPLAWAGAVKAVNMVGSTLAELPALYRYVKKSRDWYGAGEHLLLKPVKYLIPFIGPALDLGSFNRMVGRRIRKESKFAFLKEVQGYRPIGKVMRERIHQPIGDAIALPA